MNTIRRDPSVIDMPSAPEPVARWPVFLGHALTVATLAVGGLSSFHAIRADVVELRTLVAALVQTEADHTRRGEADLRALREELRELRGEVRQLIRLTPPENRP
jgi:hypothetical protein